MTIGINLLASIVDEPFHPSDNDDLCSFGVESLPLGVSSLSLLTLGGMSSHWEFDTTIRVGT